MTDRGDDEHVLTRDLLHEGGMLHMVARCAPATRVLTDEQRAEALRRTLAARPADTGRGVWLFAYGCSSGTRRCASRDAVSRARTGGTGAFACPPSPGAARRRRRLLVLGLDRGGACTGAAFHVAEELVGGELALLWRREMLSGSYAPRWVPLRAFGGDSFGRGGTFTIDRASPFYAGALSEDEVVRRLATARGELGSPADRLFRTRDGLRSLGIRDPTMEQLAGRVARARETPAARSPPL